MADIAHAPPKFGSSTNQSSRNQPGFRTSVHDELTEPGTTRVGYSHSTAPLGLARRRTERIVGAAGRAVLAANVDTKVDT